MRVMDECQYLIQWEIKGKDVIVLRIGTRTKKVDQGKEDNRTMV